MGASSDKLTCAASFQSASMQPQPCVSSNKQDYCDAERLMEGAGDEAEGRRSAAP